MATERKFKGLAQDFIKAIKTQFIGKGADPNDIFVQDLYNYETPVTQGSALAKLLNKKQANLITQLSTEDRKILETILKVYNDHIYTKRELLHQSRQLFETDIVQTVIDVMIDDGFNSFNNEKEEFRIEYDLDEDEKDILGEDFQDKVQTEIDDFVEKFGLKTRVAEMVPELLRDGEYAYGVLYNEQEKEGITEIIDDMDVANMLPFYEGDKLSFVIRQETYDDIGSGIKHNVLKNGQFQPPKFYKPDNIIFFRLKGPTKKRINLSMFYDNEFRKEFYERTNIRLPKYVRIPVPIYYSAMKNLNRLQVMENVSTVLDLADVLKPEIVSVTVPTTTAPEEAAQIIRDYERRLNDNSGLSDQDSLDIATLATQANRRKVVPQWMDSKGTLQSSGIGSNDSSKSQSAWNSINNIRNLIALSIGIPPFYINISDSPQDKAQIIKLYSRYTRKLTSLQKTLADGIKDIIMLHLDKKGIHISRDNLSVKFKAITSGDSLDDTDMMVATVTGINDLYKGIEEITSSENNNLVIDDQQFKQLFDNLTSRYLNISDLIKISDSKFNDEEFNDEGFEPLGAPSGGSNDRLDNEPNFEPSEGPKLDTVDRSNEEAYNDFATAEDNLDIDNTQEIETEV